MDWIKDEDPDAEYNQHFTVAGEDADQFLIYSDREGVRWDIEFPDGNTESLGASSLEEAIEAATASVNEYLKD